MHDAYSQALRFYLVRPLRSLQLGVFAAMGLAWTVTAMVSQRRGGTDATTFLLGHVFLCMVLWFMFREQVIGTRRCLLPDFVGPQVAAFAVVSAVVVALMSVAASGGGEVSVVRAAALVSVLFACVGLLVLTQSVVLFGVFFILAYGPAVGLPAIAWSWITPGAAPAVLLASVAAVVLVVVGYFRTTEESSWYRGPSGTELFPRATGDGNQSWAAGDGRWYQRLRFRRHWPADAKARPFRRVRRWRSQNRVGFLLMAAWFCGISIYFRWPTPHQTSLPFPRPQPDMSFLFLGMMVSQTWLLRWRYLAAELLRPVTRPTFFKQLGGAMAVDFALAFAVSTAAMAVPQFLFWPARDAWRGFVLQAVGQAGLFVLLFAVTALLLRHRSRGLLMLNGLVLMPGFVLPFVLPELSRSTGAMVGFVTAVAAVGLIGVALSVRAYRSWLDVELV